MSKQNNILGVAKFELGETGDGVMGTVLTEFTDIEVSSVTLEGAQSTETTIATESDDAYLTVSDTSTPASVTARLYGVTAEQLVQLAGGKVNADVGEEDEGKWEAPSSSPNIYQSFRMEGKAINGTKTVLKMPYAKVTARLQGTITKNGLPAVDVTLTANTPKSEAGVSGSPVIYGTEAVV